MGGHRPSRRRPAAANLLTLLLLWVAAAAAAAAAALQPAVVTSLRMLLPLPSVAPPSSPTYRRQWRPAAAFVLPWQRAVAPVAEAKPRSAAAPCDDDSASFAASRQGEEEVNNQEDEDEDEDEAKDPHLSPRRRTLPTALEDLSRQQWQDERWRPRKRKRPPGRRESGGPTAPPRPLAAPAQTQYWRRLSWSVRRRLPHRPALPTTLEKAAEAATWAVASSLLSGENEGRRIGIEFDGFPATSTSKADDKEGRAVRRFSLLLALQLSEFDWSGGGKEEAATPEATEGGALRRTSRTRTPVAVYANTIQQSLATSRELRGVLMRMIQQTKSASQRQHHWEKLPAITIRCLTQDPTLPPCMLKPASSDEKPAPPSKRSRSRSPRSVHPANNSSGSAPDLRGIALVVSPADYASEDRPPGPTLGSALALQRLCVRASLEGDAVAVVVVSPRFVKKNGLRGGRQQDDGNEELPSSSSHQPWILRDFFPPAYSYVAIPSLRRTVEIDSSSSSASPQELGAAARGRLSSILVMTQSRGEDHDSARSSGPTATAGASNRSGATWHMFERYCYRGGRQASGTRAYEYLASASAKMMTMTRSHHPSASEDSPSPSPFPPPFPSTPSDFWPRRELLRWIWEEFSAASLPPPSSVL